MLQPTNRFTLFDSLRPPEGFSFDGCIATTFTLDLKALLALPGIFAMHRDADAVTDRPPVEILHAIRKHASQITIFAQAGEIAVPPSTKVFGFLEGSVVPVTAPKKGVVHPKVWVLRFTKYDSPNESVLRVIIASRNLTFDSSWDSIVRLDQSDKGTSLAPIVGLFEGLSNQAVSPIDSSHADRVSSICNDLQNALFQIPSPFESMTSHVLGIDKSTSPFPQIYDRSVVISPFISSEFFERVLTTPVDMLVSREDQFKQVKDIQTINERLCFEDGSNPDETEGPLGPAEPIRGLHAKIFGFESQDQTTWFLGSANATGAAFRSNVELLLELTGPTHLVGIDKALGGDDDDAGMRRLFRDYKDSAGLDSDEVEADGFDALRREIASQGFVGTAFENEKGWNVTYSTLNNITAPEGIEIYIWPTNDAQSKRRIELNGPLDQTFVSTLTDISGFLGIELRSPAGNCTFCVPVQLNGIPDERETQLMKALIGNAERFLGYLVALLDESSFDNSEEGPAFGEGAGTWKMSNSFDMPPVLEKMLKAMRSDQSKLLDIASLVRDLDNDGILPPGFIEVWSAVLEVAGSVK
jgi:hypothetical protein